MDLRRFPGEARNDRRFYVFSSDFLVLRSAKTDKAAPSGRSKRRSWLIYIIGFTAGLVLLPSFASSQSNDASDDPQSPPGVSPEPSPHPVPERHLNVSWQDGLVLESDDGNYRVQFGALVRFDGRFVPDEPQHRPPNTFMMRNLRPTIQGRFAKYFTFRLVPDVAGNGNPTVQDAWIDIALSDAVHLRFGRDKVPMSVELQLQDSNVVFLERGLTVNLLPLRDTGVQMYGNLHGGVISYAVGVFNGQVDGAANNSNSLDTNNAKDVVGRLVVQPFNKGAVKPLRRLTLAIGASTGQQQNAPLPYFETSVWQTYFSYANDAIPNGVRTRISPQVSYYFKRFGGYAEYVRSRQGVSRGAVNADITNTAWQVVGSVLVTGETAGERIRPIHAFDPARREWGALQLTARYGALSVDPIAFALRLADASASRQVQVATAGANWYLTANVKTMFNVERSVFDRDPNGLRPVEHAVLFRIQFSY